MHSIPSCLHPTLHILSSSLVVSVALDSLPITVGEGDGHVSVAAVLSGMADYTISATIHTRPYSGPCKCLNPPHCCMLPSPPMTPHFDQSPPPLLSSLTIPSPLPSPVFLSPLTISCHT